MSFINIDEGFAIVEPEMYCSSTNEQQQCCLEEAATSSKVFRSHGVDFFRQPCKARGIEIQGGQNPHVARFAYIDIPVGTKHGTVLSCCHPVCIDSGRRFRYCIHCKTAVAKRNFNVRHAHGNLNSPPPTFTSSCQVVVKTEVVETADVYVPSIISIDDNHKIEDHNSIGIDTVMIALNAQEVEIINLIRCRPGDDYPTKLNQWKESLLKMTEKLTVRPSQLSSSSLIDAIHASNDYKPATTPDVDESSVASFDPEDFEDFDFSEVTSFFD